MMTESETEVVELEPYERPSYTMRVWVDGEVVETWDDNGCRYGE